jgi:hypothetical protein
VARGVLLQPVCKLKGTGSCTVGVCIDPGACLHLHVGEEATRALASPRDGRFVFEQQEVVVHHNPPDGCRLLKRRWVYVCLCEQSAVTSLSWNNSRRNDVSNPNPRNAGCIACPGEASRSSTVPERRPTSCPFRRSTCCSRWCGSSLPTSKTSPVLRRW